MNYQLSAAPRWPAAALTLATLFAPAIGHSQGSNYGQFAPEDAYEDGSPLAYYGSENQWNRRQFRQGKADAQYKRRGQRQILAILEGKPEDALRWCERRLKEDPQDQESMFTRTAAYCKMGQIDRALASMQEAVAAGLPIERFLAGPREVLKPLTELAEFRQLAATHTTGLVHGPMLGCVTDRRARVWVRTQHAQQVSLRVFVCDEQGRPTDETAGVASGSTDAGTDYTTTIELTDLKPGTRYAYNVIVNERPALKNPLPQFRTLPPAGEPVDFKFAFGGGAGYTPQYERMWDTIASQGPDALFLLGDNVYIDLAEEPKGLHQYTYYRRQSRPEFRRLVRSTPVYAIWDDHDCAIDDVWMGPYIDKPSWKPAMLRVFRENWVNPGYGSDAAPGCWFAKSIGDVDFFFLDCRYYRTNPFGKRPTMLGPVQQAWLLDRLKQSTAKVKVLVSAVAWAPNAKPGSRDTWDGFVQEREEIFSFLDAERIEGVLLLSADRHRSDARKIERPGGHALYDLMSSRLTNMHMHECVPGAIFCYNEKCSFGLVRIDTTKADPRITFQVVSIDGEIPHARELSGSELPFR